MTTAPTDTYSRKLLIALRGREVPSDRIAEVVAEVESHVAETGEDPHDAFGAPHEYAAVVAASQPRRILRVVLALALGGLTGWLVATTAASLVRGEGEVFGIAMGLAVPAVLVLAVVTALVAQRHHRPVVDPRTGERRLVGGGAPLVAVLLVAVGLIAAVTVVIEQLTR